MSTPPEDIVPTEADDQAPEAAEVTSAGETEAGGLGPWYALLRAAVGARMPEGPLGPDTVPAQALALAVDLAIENLVKHAKKCHNPRCPHVPPPLQVYRHMRPDAIRNARPHVHKTLWTHPNHELVKWVREQILKTHPEAAQAVADGQLLVGDRLEQALDEPGLLALAAVLWAGEFKGPHAETLFRSLVALTEPDRAEDADEEKSVEENGNSRSFKAKYRSAIRERDRVAQTAKQAALDLQQKDRALEKARRDVEDLQRKLRQTTDSLENAQRRLHESDLAYRDAKRDTERSTKVAAALRRDLREQQRAWSELEIARAELALQLANERRTIEHLKLELGAVPRGADAVQAFLRDAEDRIDIARTITAGGDKERADQDWNLHRKLKGAFLDAYPRYKQPPPTKVRTKTSAQLVALGGSGEVGRSCYLLQLGKHRILVDCGIKPSAAEDLHPQLEQLDRVDALVLTHAHTDHIGWVPALVRRFPDVGIYCSEATAALLPVMLDDCYQHYMRKILTQRDRARYIANAAPVQEHYDLQDVQAVSGLVIKCMFNEEEGLPFGDASLSFFPAGHILGAASVLVQDLSGRRVFFSGDFASVPQLTVQAAEWPDGIGDVDLLVLESTYGGRDPHKPVEDSRNELIAFTRKTIEAQGSVILVSFGLGRAQELLKLLARAQDNGELPHVTVYVDGMIKRINPIYKKLGSYFRRALWFLSAQVAVFAALDECVPEVRCDGWPARRDDFGQRWALLWRLLEERYPHDAQEGSSC